MVIDEILAIDDPSGDDQIPVVNSVPKPKKTSPAIIKALLKDEADKLLKTETLDEEIPN